MFLLLQSTHRMVIQHHPTIGHLFVPNLRARIPNELGGYYVRTNSLGFRSDIEFRREKGGRPRILFFGDSNTAGDGCENRERFPELIGQELGAEVFNYGLPGSGTDQQLLIFEQFARGVEADLIVICVSVHNIERIQVAARESIDRVTGKRVMVPKPFFTLDGEDLRLRNVPVSLHRAPVEAAPPGTAQDDSKSQRQWTFKLREFYQSEPRLTKTRRLIQARFPRVKSEIIRRIGFQPHPEYLTPRSHGWRLMEAILKRFFSGASPTPVLLVPIPTYYFYFDGIDPIYQGLYESLALPEKEVHVADITTPLRRLSPEERTRMSFQYDYHFSQFGHRQIADVITKEIDSKRLLPERRRPTPPAGERIPTPPRPTYVLGLSCFYHNSAACLIKDGEIVAAAEEERFTRVKNDRRFPRHAANYCLEQGGIHQRDLSAVVYYDNAPLTFERLMHTQVAAGPKGEKAWLRAMPSWVLYKLHLPRLIRRHLRYEGLILHEIHHRSHAASAFYPSPFEQAAILTVDGVGEWATASIGVGSRNEIRLLKEMRFPNSLGLLYSAFTQFTGFKVNSGEYKMMGLAPYGDPKYVGAIYDHIVELKADGSLELNQEYFAYLSEPTMTSPQFAELFGGPARQPDSRITQREMDIARSIQVVTEEAVLRMARHAHQLTGERRLCLAGGVALNCVANGRLLREGPFEDIWIQPAAGDAGSALGAALDVYHSHFNNPRVLPGNGRPAQGGSYWGPSFSGDEIRAFLDTHGYPYQALPADSRGEVIAGLLETGKVVGHFCGRAEFGPRALGARSILGDARNEEMQVNLNVKIKYRESFRPFAPTVLAERAGDYFQLDRESPYMLLVAPVNERRQKAFRRVPGDDLLAVVRQQRSDIPAVTHVDYSARVQTIAREDHPAYYDLIHAFERRTGCAVVVNTSFNVRGEPIVCSPYDAYRCFMRTDMDALVLGNHLLFKEQQPPWPEDKGHVEEQNWKQEEEDDGALLKALWEVYTNEFMPVAESLQRQGAGQVSAEVKSQRLPTTWADYDSNQSAADIFLIPDDLDSPTPDAEKMAEAITRFWSPGAATDALRPVLVKLLKVGRRFAELQSNELEEKVADSVYVMY
jgi:carbamoyltransferase